MTTRYLVELVSRIDSNPVWLPAGYLAKLFMYQRH